MNTRIDFRYVYITPEAIRVAVWNNSKTFFWNLKELQRVIKKVILYNIEILEFQYNLLERLERRSEYQIIKQVERDIKIIEERLNIYREFDKIAQL